MNTPTKEQIDAAKAWACSSPSAPISAEQYAALEAYVEANKGTPGLWQWSDAPAFILLAALESAEAKVEAMASRESASVSKEIETSADMLAQVQNAEARVKELEQQLRGTMQAGGYDYFSQQLQECERYWGIARNYAEQMKKKLEAAEADSARLDWLNEHPESVPYLDDGLWRIPYEVSGAGGFGGGVGEMHHRTLRGVIDAARKEAQP